LIYLFRLLAFFVFSPVFYLFPLALFGVILAYRFFA